MFAVGLVLWSCGLVLALSEVEHEFPNPRKEFRMCGNQKQSYVCDPDFILDRGDVDKLNNLAEELRRSTGCLCETDCLEDTGIQMGIYLKNNISDNSIVSESSGKEMATTIRQQWNLGTCDDDILLLLIIQPNITSFSLGSSVEGLLTEEMAAQIVDECQFHFDSGYFYQGLESVVSSFHDVISREQKRHSNDHTHLVFGIVLGGAILLVLMSGILALYFKQRKRRKQSCSNIYVSDVKNEDRKNIRPDQLEQLQKLNQKCAQEELETVS